MSSIPFRTAFWALGLAFMMTVMLLVPNPKKIRMALHARREAAEFPFEETLITSLDAPEVIPVEPAEALDADTASPSEAEPASLLSALTRRRRTRSAPAAEPEPVRVASADPTASIGYQPPPTRPFVETKAPESKSPPASVPTEEEAMVQLDIPVPEPQHDAPKPRLAAAMPAGPAVQSSVREVLTPVKEPMSTLAAPAFPETPTMTSKPTGSTLNVAAGGTAPLAPPSVASRRVDTMSSAAVVELSTDDSMSITAGTLPQRWNFRFRESDLSTVFKVLGQYQGFTVVVDDQLNGIFSGQFLDADPAQAFAALVKSRGCRVSRRGNIILLNQRSTLNLH